MGSSVTIALISAGAVVLAAVVGFLGVVVARRSDKDDDTREWVTLRMAKQDDDIRKLREGMERLEGELRTEQEAGRIANRRTISVVGYVREVLSWVGLHFPDERPPVPHGLAREVLNND